MFHVYLVDFENVAKKGLIGIDELDQEDLVYVFYSNSKSNITAGLRDDMFACKAQNIHQKVITKSPNALDFQLSMEAGRLLETDTVKRISIISEDRGYEAVVEYAARVKPSIVVDQQPFILEAKRMEGCTAEEIRRKQEPQKLGRTFMEADRRKQFDKEIRKAVPDIEDEEVEMLRGIFLEPISRREKYLKALKTFGKDRGLILYRGEVRGKLSEKYLTM